MSRMPLYFKRGYPGHGPGPYRRLLRSRHAAWRVANKHGDAIQRVREVHQWVVDDEDDPWQVSFATGWDAALAEVRRALDDAEQSEYWDGTTPLGDDDMDGQ